VVGKTKAPGSSSRLSSGDSNKERIAELLSQIEVEAQRLAVVRAELLKTKSGGSSVGAVVSTTVDNVASKAVASVGVEAAAAKDSGDKRYTGAQRGVPCRPVPEETLPELARYIVAAGYDGITKIVAQLIESHPVLAKRQVERKIMEIAVKEKRADDINKIWHLKPEFEYLLALVADESKKSASKKKKSLASPADELKSVSADEPKKVKGSSSSTAQKGKASADVTKPDTPVTVAKTDSSSKVKRKAPELTSPSPTTATLKEPTRSRTAFWFFVKDHRAEQEASMNNPSTEELKERIQRMWEELSDTDREEYKQKKIQDEARYERELTVFLEAGGKLGEDSATRIKKRKKE